jgi:hypothetical protein
VWGDSLEEIAREFRAATYSSVSSVIERIKAMIVKDRVFGHRVEELKEEIYMSQEQTLLLLCETVNLSFNDKVRGKH